MSVYRRSVCFCQGHCSLSMSPAVLRSITVTTAVGVMKKRACRQPLVSWTLANKAGVQQQVK